MLVRETAKECLRYFPRRELFVPINNTSILPANVMAYKACGINFPRLIKQSLVNLPTSLEETEMNSRSKLIQQIRQIYYSEVDKETFKVLFKITDFGKSRLVIDHIAGPYYSALSQLKYVYEKASLPQKEISSKNIGFIAKHSSKFATLRQANNSILFKTLEAYDENNDKLRFVPKLSRHRNANLPYYKQLSSKEKDVIFDPVLLGNRAAGRLIDQNPMVNIDEAFERIFKRNKSYDHLVVRGELIYTELSLNNQVVGIGLDLNHSLSSQRAAKMAFVNPKVAEIVKSINLSPNKVELFNSMRQHCKKLDSEIIDSTRDNVNRSEEEIASWRSQELEKFFS